jgi:phosphoglycerate dehydrogenase-like enzyme
MPVTVALYDRALEMMATAIDGLGLDLNILTFNKDGKLFAGAAEVDPAETAIDYVWLSPLISRDKAQEPVFELMLKVKSIDVLQTFNAGLDHPFYGKIKPRGTRVCNSSAQAMAISEYVVGQVMNLYQPFAEQKALQEAATWQITPFREIWRTNWLIVGFGPIGTEIARKVKAFGASTSVVRRSPQTSDIVDQAGTLADLARFAPDADLIVLACPLNAETRGFANEAFFNAIKPGSILLNIGRGALIEDAALIAALDDGRLANAVLDVFHEEPLPTANPLWSHPKVRVTAHTSFAGGGGQTRWMELFLDNLPRYARGEVLVNEVNSNDIA